VNEKGQNDEVSLCVNQYVAKTLPFLLYEPFFRGLAVIFPGRHRSLLYNAHMKVCIVCMNDFNKITIILTRGGNVMVVLVVQENLRSLIS